MRFLRWLARYPLVWLTVIVLILVLALGGAGFARTASNNAGCQPQSR